MSGTRNFFLNIIYGNAVTAVIRICLGAMLLFSGSVKAMDLGAFGSVIARYGILPPHLVPYPAIVIPFLEIIAGFLILIGYRVRASSFISVILMALFTVVIAVNVIRGENFECGCFELGRIGLIFEERIGYPLLMRDILFLLLFTVLYRAGRHLLSVDQFLDNRGLKNL